jgi:hypothetical protein
MKDMKGLGHDYLLTNPVLQDNILEATNENLQKKDRKVEQMADTK